VREIAATRDATPGQVALAWLQAQGDDVVPIPGTKRRKYLEENVAALELELSADDVARLEALTPVGARYADSGWVNRDTPTPPPPSAP
jgi:aryl-alcohol dehydrogenase-like predicted oxidoreductase